MARSSDNDDVVSGVVLLRKGAEADQALRGVEAKVAEMNDHILPAGVKIVPFIDRSDLVHFTTHTVLHNLTEGIILVVIILFLFLGNVRGAIIVALTIPFSLLFAATCLQLKGIPANLLSLGALDFGMVVDGAVVMVENIIRHLSHRQQAAEAAASGNATTPGRNTVLVNPPGNRSAKPHTKFSGRCFLQSRSLSPPTCPSSRCSGSKDACSGPWLGPSRLPSLGR
jgi:Cu/Ag efflux pump CusA